MIKHAILTIPYGKIGIKILQKITINRPDDWHIHLRDGDFLRHTVPAVAKDFHRALVMPNLSPALTSIKTLIAYRERILKFCPLENQFYPLMTFYLKETLCPEELENCHQHPYIIGAKLYPAGATTNSSEGVQSLQALYPLLDIMQERDLVLQIHAEVTYGDIYEREALFIEEHIAQLLKNFPKLRIVLEHISSKAAVDFVKDGPDTLAATVTPQHLLYNRNQLLAGGLRPHYYCLPILKHASDQKAIQAVLRSGHRKFFAGTDSAPHAKASKENACGCAGIYSSPFALALYTKAFEDLSALHHLNAFLSRFGADFYKLPYSKEEVTLIKKEQTVPHELPFGDTSVVPIAAGETLPWSIL